MVAKVLDDQKAYLTQMKELTVQEDTGAEQMPPQKITKPTETASHVEIKNKTQQEAPSTKRSILDPESEAPAKPAKATGDVGNHKKYQPAETVVAEDGLVDDDDVESAAKLPITTKEILLGIVNLVSLVLLFILLNRLTLKANEVRSLHNESLTTEANLEFVPPDLKDSREKIADIETVYLDESGIVDFVRDVEGLKSESGVIKKISFASPKVVKDRTGNFGIPVIIDIEGTWEEVDKAFQDVDSLPYLFRAANIVIKQKEDNVEVLEVNFGGFLYVNDKLGEVR